MARRRDKLLAEVRKYFGLKNIKSWEGYNKSLSLDKNWDGVIEEYRRQRSARSIQRAWRYMPRRMEPTDVVEWNPRRTFDPGDNIVEYSFDIKFTSVSRIVEEVRQAMLAVPQAKPGDNFKIIAKGDVDHSAFHASYLPSKRLALEDFKDKLITYSQQYENNFVIGGIIVSVFTPNPENGAGGVGRTYQQANKTWKIVSPNTKKNCAYASCVVSLHGGEPPDLSKKARTLKARVKPKNTMRDQLEEMPGWGEGGHPLKDLQTYLLAVGNCMETTEIMGCKNVHQVLKAKREELIKLQKPDDEFELK